MGWGNGDTLAAAGAVAGRDFCAFRGRILHESDGIDAYAATGRVFGVVVDVGGLGAQFEAGSAVMARGGGDVVA